MTVAELRDLAIVFTSILNTAILIFLGVIVFSTYCRVKGILNTLSQAALALKESAEVVNQCIKGFDVVSRLFKKKRGGKEQ